eukprot:scaffold69046_cov77-Phaeocystis_antarctica.AAC.9
MLPQQARLSVVSCGHLPKATAITAASVISSQPRRLITASSPVPDHVWRLACRQRVPERLRQLNEDLAREPCEGQRAIDRGLLEIDIGARLGLSGRVGHGRSRPRFQVSGRAPRSTLARFGGRSVQ